VVIDFFLALLCGLRVFFRSRVNTALEVIALRQQLTVFKRKQPRPALTSTDRLFWITLCRLWCGWKNVLLIVKPETVVGWHRTGFRLYWSCRSRRQPGRRKISNEVRELIHRLAQENHGWGAPKIHGELMKLGFNISERSVSRYLRRMHRHEDRAKSCLTFLRNHREIIVAFDLFTVPTLTFQQLYCFFVIEHRRRCILHCNVTRHPTAGWVLQQLREAFPEVGPYRYVILDRDTKFDTEVISFLKSTGLKPMRTCVQAPWQNGIAERWIGSCRRELLNHIIALNERHLLRLLHEYVAYHHDDRIHDSLGKDCPHSRVIEYRPDAKAKIIASARVGGLHHRYFWRAAA
jgi:putative transposase